MVVSLLLLETEKAYIYTTDLHLANAKGNQAHFCLFFSSAIRSHIWNTLFIAGLNYSYYSAAFVWIINIPHRGAVWLQKGVYAAPFATCTLNCHNTEWQAQHCGGCICNLTITAIWAKLLNFSPLVNYTLDVWCVFLPAEVLQWGLMLLLPFDGNILIPAESPPKGGAALLSCQSLSREGCMCVWRGQVSFSQLSYWNCTGSHCITGERLNQFPSRLVLRLWHSINTMHRINTF